VLWQEIERDLTSMPSLEAKGVVALLDDRLVGGGHSGSFLWRSTSPYAWRTRMASSVAWYVGLAEGYLKSESERERSLRFRVPNARRQCTILSRPSHTLRIGTAAGSRT
jgi:hypothetical protein